MKAFLLAAGKGGRLSPLTDKTPKCLLPINGEPLLGRWLRSCKKSGVGEVLVNLHHLPDEVRDYLKENSYGVKVNTFYEKELLGSAGTVAKNKDFVKGEKCFYIIYADVLTDADLGNLSEFHLAAGGFFTMGLYRTLKPKECGIAALDKNGVITGFIEKPAAPASNLANSGIYVVGSEIFDYIPEGRFADFGFDVLPKLCGKMRGFIIKDYVIDIGTHENYKRANVHAEKCPSAIFLESFRKEGGKKIPRSSLPRT